MKTPLEHLESFMKCPQCNEPYEDSKALLIETDQRKTTFHITCGKCNISTLVSVAVNQLGLVSMGSLTDLDRQEVKRLFQREPISSDEVLDVHKYFEAM